MIFNTLIKNKADIIKSALFLRRFAPVVRLESFVTPLVSTWGFFYICGMATLKDIVKAMEAKGYEVDKRPYALNVVGIRNSKPVSQDRYDDEIAYFYYDNNGRLQGKVAIGTTDPSTYFLKNPMNEGGAAILKGGQYKGAYTIGTHAGKYTALVQQGAPVTVIRDGDRDGYTNFLNATDTGYFGINIHRSTRTKNDATLIGMDSAGCQVFQNEEDFNEMMRRAHDHKAKYGNKFTYTLLDDRDAKRTRNTWIVLVAGLAGVSYILYRVLRAK